MILEWLLDLLLPCCETVVCVLSPEGRAAVEPELERLAPGRYRVAIQEVPRGMGDAVEIGVADVETPYSAVIWGDQVAIRPSSIDVILRLHQGALAPDLTIPTVLRPKPYIHFERNPQGEITRLLQAREGDHMPEEGESDAGFFCFGTAVLRRLLAELHERPHARGAHTDEFNFLPVIPFAVSKGHRVLTPHVMEVEETVGINAAADALSIESFLRGRHG
jgi:bifunctional N-acetylglucosamine-1-phosphate-uridyltransferase/glucosamine-1-phosphate-acetyltransferase GlmU-like protein